MKNNIKLLLALGLGLLALFFGFHLLTGTPKTSDQKIANSHETQAEHKDAHSDEKTEHDPHEDEAEGSTHSDAETPSVTLTENDIREFNIAISQAGPGELNQYIELPGEVAVNSDKVVQIVPNVSGVIKSAFKNIGYTAKKGETLASLESQALADSKAAYIIAIKREELTQANLNREETLNQKKATTEMEYQEAKNAHSQAHIELKLAKQKLLAMGLSDAYLKQLPDHPQSSFTQFDIKAPFNGTIIEKAIVQGSTIAEDATAFVLADMSQLWVNINVYQSHLASLKIGQSAIISPGNGLPDIRTTISHISPLSNNESRTITARAVVSNPDKALKPGFFVTAKLLVSRIHVPVLIPKTALFSENGQSIIYILKNQKFTAQPITIGRKSDTHVEVLSGLVAGQSYVKDGGFTVKAQFAKGSLGDGHNH